MIFDGKKEEGWCSLCNKYHKETKFVETKINGYQVGFAACKSCLDDYMKDAIKIVITINKEE